MSTTLAQPDLFTPPPEPALPAPLIALRPYQQEAVAAVRREWSYGKRATLVAMATGCGKTEVALGALHAEAAAGLLSRALILAHRRELIDQPLDRITRHWPSLAPAGVVMAERDEPGCRVVIATVQTLLGSKRMARLLEAGAFSHLVIDEGHHATADSYQAVRAQLLAANPALRVLGITATPKRTDGDGLVRVFDSVAYRLSIEQAIRAGALVSFRALGVQLPVSFKGVRAVGDGWDDEAAGSVLSARNAEELIIHTWREHAGGARSMAFCASVRQAHSLAAAFVEAGIAAEAADGTSPDRVRAAVVERYRSGQTRVLCNCALWTEGFDVPETGCILQVRPTKSDLVYVQMVGRGLRLAPGKQECVILDYVPQDARDLVMAGDLLGRPKPEPILEQAIEAGVILSSFGILGDGTGVDADPEQVRVRLLGYLAAAPLAWSCDAEVASVSIGSGQSLGIRLPARRHGRYRVALVEYRRAYDLGMAGSWDEAIGIAERWAGEHATGLLARKNAWWRRQPASEKQEACLRRIGRWRDGMRKGEASQTIAHHDVRLAMA